MRLLIISPHFPPTNAADMQRVRLSVPYLYAAGVEAELLSVEPDQVSAPQDSWLCDGLPENVLVHRVKVLGLEWRRIPGLGTLTFRAKRAIRKRGNQLLASGGFDLVYFSTTQFGIHSLGPEWKMSFGVPFVIDYQDPWVNDYYEDHPEVRPPGGRVKYGVTNRIARWQEPRVLKECCGITSVSAAYPVQLCERYEGIQIESVAGNSAKGGEVRKLLFPRFQSDMLSLVLPFPGDNRDLELAKSESVTQEVFDPDDGFKHWVYVGRGGPDMARAVKALFRAIQDQELKKRNGIRLHFIGTSYAGAGKGLKTIEPIAAEFGLGDIVLESPDRIPYSETLKCLLDADALIVPGSDDPAYTASKIYPYLLAEKPLLAIFHEKSSIVKLFEEVEGGSCITFSDFTDEYDLAEKIGRIFSEEPFVFPLVKLNFEPLSNYLAPSQANQLACFFQQCVESGYRRA